MTPPEPRADVSGALDLVGRIAAAVLGTPGVVRLEPTLHSALLRLTPRRSEAGTTVARAAVDGISLRQTDGLTDVTLDLVTTLDRPARETAELVQQRVVATVVQAGHQAGRIAVTVLSVERA